MKSHDAEKIAVMKEGGAMLHDILEELLTLATPGVNLLDIEKLAMKRIKATGGIASFTTVADYKWATCLCVNEVVVHGIPYSYTLKEHDVLTIDVGLLYKKYHTDTAGTKIMLKKGVKPDPKVQKFLDTGKRALDIAMSLVKPGNRVGHLSQALQTVVEKEGYGIVKSLVGHGVGTTLHEAPQIPGVLRGKIERTPVLTPGMTIAIEVIYAMGNPAVWYPNDDGWSIATRDGSLTSVFEHTLAVTDDGSLVLT